MSKHFHQISELRLVTRTKYKNAYVEYREHPKNRYRLQSGVRADGSPSKVLCAWTRTEREAWMGAYRYTLQRIARDVATPNSEETT